MTCGGCAASVKRMVQGVDRNADVSVELENKKVTVKSEAGMWFIQILGDRDLKETK